MEIKIVSEKENYLEIEVDTDESLLNYLAELINNHKGYSAKAYKDHPLFEKPRLIIQGKNPREILKESIKEFRKEITTIKKSLN